MTDPCPDSPASPTTDPPLVRFTDAARDRVVASMDVEGGDRLALRIEVQRVGPAGFDYGLTFVGLDERESDDRVVDAGPFQVFVDPESAGHLRGTTISFVHTLQRVGFEFDNPNAGWDDPVADAVQRVIDDEINPKVGSHGGMVTLVAVRDGVARLEMHGGCKGCGKAEVTLRDGVEQLILERVPEVRDVVDATDHDAGDAPFFAPGQGGRSPFADGGPGED